MLELHYLHDVIDNEPNSEVMSVTAGVVTNPTGSMRLDLGLRQGAWGKNADQRLSGSINTSFTFGHARER